mgnify:CR=1 FL=1
MVNSNEIKIATYNLNGAKHKLASTLAQARIGGVHVLYVQELHHYNDGWHLRVRNLARSMGWDWFQSSAPRGDPGCGVAVAIRKDRSDVLVESWSVVIPGRLIVVKAKIETETVSLASIYLNAQPSRRKDEIKTLHAAAEILSHTILAGDFNCVESVHRDTRSNEGANPYTNPGGRALTRALATHGLTDIHVLVDPGLKDQFTRCGHQTYTRIDRIYAAEYYSTWRLSLIHI